MAVKKRKGKKKAAKKANPLVALKARLTEIKSQSSAVTAQAKETAKRADALVKGMVGSPAPAAKKAKKKTKKRAKKRTAKKK